MDRKIKFRGWDEKLEIMVYYYSGLSSIDGSCLDAGEAFRWCINEKMKKDCFLSVEDVETESVFIQCTPTIFMQYIGQKDKNGVEVFTGDVVQQRMPAGYAGEIGLQKEIVKRDDFFFFPFTGGDYSYSEECEIIGNIYQNPELLEDSTH